jgi:hypothetical protein
MGSTGRLVFRALVLIAVACSVRAETEPQAQAVIRGTGTNVTIAYRHSVTARVESPVASSGESPLTEAARMKSAGASDDSVVAYLRLKQADLPAVVSIETVDQLRKAGAGRPVIALLSSLTAIEIGETGEGGEAVAAYQPIPGAQIDAAGYGSGDYYGSGGYAGWGGSWGGRLVGRGHFPSRGHGFFPGVKPFPVPPRHMPMHPSVSVRTSHAGTRMR